jgi:hypothetical protein
VRHCEKRSARLHRLLLIRLLIFWYKENKMISGGGDDVPKKNPKRTVAACWSKRSLIQGHFADDELHSCI